MLAVVAIFSFVLMGAAPGQADAEKGGAGSTNPDLRVSGVLEQLDLTASKGMLKTATGKPVFFEIVKPELFRNISVGEQVTIQLDERGRAVKAIESHSIPELPAPSH